MPTTFASGSARLTLSVYKHYVIPRSSVPVPHTGAHDTDEILRVHVEVSIVPHGLSISVCVHVMFATVYLETWP